VPPSYQKFTEEEALALAEGTYFAEDDEDQVAAEPLG